MACSRWGEPFFFLCLAGTLTCCIPWLAVWRAEVWPHSFGGHRSRRLVKTLLWLSIGSVLFSGIIGSLAYHLVAGLSDFLALWAVVVTGPIAGLCCCIAALLIQFSLNRWIRALSTAAVLFQLGILVPSLI